MVCRNTFCSECTPDRLTNLIVKLLWAADPKQLVSSNLFDAVWKFQQEYEVVKHAFLLLSLFFFSQTGSLSNSTCSHVRSSPAVRTGSASISFPVSQEEILVGNHMSYLVAYDNVFVYFTITNLGRKSSNSFLNSCVIVPLL